MKVAIYSIALNEEKHVKRWYESTKEADYHLIADTGSTDNTVKIARELGIQVYEISVKPFRFDMARNASLALLPADADYCVALDMDEVLRPGWRQALEKAFSEGIQRPKYRFITDFNEDGTPKAEFDGFRIHTRTNIHWKYPIHEVPESYDREEVTAQIDLQSWHLPDGTKSRAYYLPLLEKAAAENPDARNLYYLGREYFYHQKLDKSLETLKKYLEVSNFPAERGYALRFMAKCVTDPKEAEEFLIRSTEEFQSRESILALANHYYHNKQWEECNKVAKIALQQTHKSTHFMVEAWAWTHMADDLIAVSAWNLGKWQEAYEHGKKAVEISPDDERLKTNLKFYKERVNANI